MAKSTGLTFIVPTKDVDNAIRFYCEAFDLQEVFRNENIAFVGSPGSDTAIGILHDPEAAGSGPQMVGVHIDHSIAVDDAVRDIESAGGKVLERGEHAPGVPFARIADPDGNVIWV